MQSYRGGADSSSPNLTPAGYHIDQRRPVDVSPCPLELAYRPEMFKKDKLN